MTQDGKDRLEDKWTYCVYDYFDQVIEQSIVTGTLSRDLIQERFDDPNFYNNLPYLGGTNDIHKPFSDDTFSGDGLRVNSQILIIFVRMIQ